MRYLVGTRIDNEDFAAIA